MWLSPNSDEYINLINLSGYSTAQITIQIIFINIKGQQSQPASARELTSCLKERYIGFNQNTSFEAGIIH